MGLLSSDDDPEQARERERRRQEASKAALRGLESNPEDTPAEKTDLLKELSESDLVSQIDDPGLRNLATKDIPTGNFDEGETAEFRAYVDVYLWKKRASNPHENQDVTGTLREWVHDDPTAGLAPVDKRDLHEDETYGRAIKARVTKGKNGSLVRRVLSSIRHSIMQRENGQEDSSGRILDRIRGGD